MGKNIAGGCYHVINADNTDEMMQELWNVANEMHTTAMDSDDKELEKKFSDLLDFMMKNNEDLTI
jgi:hypothetical protein